MKAVVIGAAGFVGQALSARLARDQAGVDDLLLADRQEFTAPAAPGLKLRTCIGDFTDPRFCQSIIAGSDAVVVLAAVLGGMAEVNYSMARRVNVDATLSLFEALRNSRRPPRVVFASSIGVFGTPLPAVVDDASPAEPTLNYGAQKLMMEVALGHFTRRGWLDGLALRLPGIVARPDADARLKSAFLSNVFFAVRDGRNIELPVSPESTLWLQSAEIVAANLCHALTLKRAAIGGCCAFTLPCIRVTVAELVAALKGRFPQSRARISYAADPELQDQFGRYPPLFTATADRLGFIADASIDDLVRDALP